MTEGVKETACTSCIHRVVCSRMREYLGIIKEIDSCTYCSEDEDNVVAIISKVDWIVMQYPLCKYYLREQKTTRLQNICNSAVCRRGVKMDSTILLLIIFADGREKIISGVKGYGHYRENINVFWFEKNGRKSFVPISQVRYFGSAFDYADEVREV